MNPRPLFLLLALCGATLAPAAEPKVPPAATSAVQPAAPAKSAAPAPTPAPASSAVAPTAAFDTFRAIVDRNIFNPNRTARRERNVEESVARVDTITLVGTMDSNRGGLQAFFDGSDRDFRKALRVGESIAAFKVVRIAAEGIDVERDGKTTAVRVGQQLRRPEGGDWTLVGEEMVRREIAAANASRIDPSAPPAIPADADEVTRRLMQRRAQQLKQ